MTGTRLRARCRSVLALLALAGLAACAAETADGDAGDAAPEPGDTLVAGAEGVEAACTPVAPGLAADASLAAMAGPYRLTLETVGPPPASVEGALVLTPLPESLREMAGAATPLAGTADIEVEAVGALRLGDLTSSDTAAPGVLVIEMRGPSIILRLGPEANRRDQVAFDGGYTVLTVHQIDDGGFEGSWRSGSRDGVRQGYFCARRSDG